MPHSTPHTGHKCSKLTTGLKSSCSRLGAVNLLRLSPVCSYVGKHVSDISAAAGVLYLTAYTLCGKKTCQQTLPISLRRCSPSRQFSPGSNLQETEKRHLCSQLDFSPKWSSFVFLSLFVLMLCLRVLWLVLLHQRKLMQIVCFRLVFDSPKEVIISVVSEKSWGQDKRTHVENYRSKNKIKDIFLLWNSRRLLMLIFSWNQIDGSLGWPQWSHILSQGTKQKKTRSN